jgi:hypothetical protein
MPTSNDGDDLFKIKDRLITAVKVNKDGLLSAGIDEMV